MNVVIELYVAICAPTTAVWWIWRQRRWWSKRFIAERACKQARFMTGMKKKSFWIELKHCWSKDVSHLLFFKLSFITSDKLNSFHVTGMKQNKSLMSRGGRGWGRKVAANNRIYLLFTDEWTCNWVGLKRGRGRGQEFTLVKFTGGLLRGRSLRYSISQTNFSVHGNIGRGVSCGNLNQPVISSLLL